MADFGIQDIRPLHVQSMEVEDERHSFVVSSQEAVDHLVHYREELPF